MRMFKIVLALILFAAAAAPARAAIWYDKLPPTGESVPKPFGNTAEPAQSFDSINLPENQVKSSEESAQEPAEQTATDPGDASTSTKSFTKWPVITVIVIILAVIAAWSWQQRKKRTKS